MDIQIGLKKNLTYGSVVSFMLDYSESEGETTISFEPDDSFGNISLNKKNNFLDYLTSRQFLFTHGVFNEYCFFHKFKNAEELRNEYLNTAFIVLPSFEYEYMENLNKIIKKIKKTGILDYPDKNIKEYIAENFNNFKQEIQTSHDKSLNLMKKDNNKVNYNDCIQLMHLKSGKFLEYKRNSKDLKTYIQLSSSMSKRTLFRFVPAFDYQSENSTKVFYFLAIQVACGEKSNNRDKYMCGEKKINYGKKKKYGVLLKGLGVKEKIEENELIITKSNTLRNIPKKSIFDPENVKDIIKDIYKDDNIEDKIIDEFAQYCIHDNLIQNNFGNKIMPDENYIIMNNYENNNNENDNNENDNNGNSFWRLINFSEDYFEDMKYLNLFNYFCIQCCDKNLFINTEIDFNKKKKDSITKSYKINDIKEIKDDENEENIEDNIINTKINKNLLDLKVKVEDKKANDSINESNINQIDLNYFYDTNKPSNKSHKLIVESFDEKDHLKPYSLFRFALKNEYFEEGEHGFGLFAKYNVINEDTEVRIFNVFTNKVLYAEKKGKNQYELSLIDDIGKDDKRYKNTIFEIKQIKDTEDSDTEENESNKSENSDNEENENSSKEEKEKTEGVKKNSYIKIYSKKFSLYLGIRIKNENNSEELTLTNSIADIIKFKLNFLDEEDQYEVNFFNQLLLGFDNILNYFAKEDITASIEGKNYERIVHILNKFKNKLNLFQKDEVDDRNLNLQKNKFDFLEIISHFNIVSKLIEIFLTNWFQNYKLYSYNEIEQKLKKYFEEKQDILRYKLIISKEILEILSKIYDLKPCYLNIMENSLLYFMMFIGRDDRCTEFLIYILNNNAFLLSNLCPLKDDSEQKEVEADLEETMNHLDCNSINIFEHESLKKIDKFQKFMFVNIKKCLKRIINDYNNMEIDKIRINFFSIVSFFNFLSVLLIYENTPFNQFYKDYFFRLGFLKVKEESNIIVPNYEQNPILIDFYINNDEIYVKNVPFSNKNNIITNKEINFKLSDLVDILSNYKIDTEEDRNKIFFAYLVNTNLIFYSHLCICEEKFGNYLKQIFKLEYVTKTFLTFTYNSNNNNVNEIKRECPLMNNIKCSIIQMLTFLYLRKDKPFLAKTHLFKCINYENNENLNINFPELGNITQFIVDIFLNQYEKLEVKKIELFCLNQFIELIGYVLRNFYLMKNNKTENIRETIFFLISKLIQLLESLIGISEQKNKFTFDLDIQEILQNILDDKLELNNPMFLVSENFEFIFNKIKYKLEKVIKKRYIKGDDVNYFKNIFVNICDNNIIQKTRYDKDLANLTKEYKKLLKNFNLKSVLMSISLNNKRNASSLMLGALINIEEIIHEFLLYCEFSTFEDLGSNLMKIPDISREDFEKGIISEISKNKISSNYLEKFIKKEYPNSNNALNKCFLKVFSTIENEKIRELALQIIFYLNSSKNIFYFNVNNLLVMTDLNQYNKFLQIKTIFENIIFKVNALNMSPRLDKNCYILITKLNEHIQELLEKLFDEDKWTSEKNALNISQDFEFEDSIGYPDSKNDNSLIKEEKEEKIEEEDDDKESEEENQKIIEEKSNEDDKNSSDKENEKNESLNLEKKISGDTIETIEGNVVFEKKIRFFKNKDCFMNEYDQENLRVFQQALFNLTFIDLIVNFFKYVDKLSEIEPDLEGKLKVLEKSIISIYKISVPFFYNNSRIQSLIKLNLYLFICPLKFKKISSELLYSINYFIYHLVYNFENKIDYAKISNMNNVIDLLFSLHQIDWNINKDVRNLMPYFFKTLLKLFDFSSPEHISPIFTLINDIKNVVIDDMNKKKKNINNVIILISLLEHLEKEHEKKEKKDLKEYKFRPLLLISNIIKLIPFMIRCLIPVTKYKPEKKEDYKYFIFARPLIILTRLLLFYNSNYIDEFESNKEEINKALIEFCEKARIRNEFIYTSKNKDKLFEYFNEFMGISLPILFKLLSWNEYQDKYIKIIEKSNEFYGKIKSILIINEHEAIFLKEEHSREMDYISKKIDKKYLSNLEWVKFKKNLFDEISEDNQDQLKELEQEKSEINLREAYNMNLNLNPCLSLENNRQFFYKANKEIEKERKKYVKDLFEFFKTINNREVCFYMSYCKSYTNYFKDYILKHRIFFFYWTNIYLMNYNESITSKNKFEEENPIYNKRFFNDLFLVDFTILRIDKMNLNINNYDNLISIKFLDSYIYKLDEEKKAEFLTKIIEMPESKNIFHFLHNILQNLSDIIKNDIEGNVCHKEQFMDICPTSITEKQINDSELAIKFLTHLAENNKIIQHKMKNYLRLQYNNTKNHNFIIIVSDILENFDNEQNRKFIPKYYDIIISIIEFLTKCCSGPCKGNQECIVKHKKVLKFTKTILKYLNYREKIYDFKGEELDESSKEKYYTVHPENRRLLSFLKYKLLSFLNALTVGSSKGDKTFGLIHQIIGFDVLGSVLVETFKEILIEKGAQKTPDNFTYGEKLLSRMKDKDKYLKGEDEDEDNDKEENKVEDFNEDEDEEVLDIKIKNKVDDKNKNNKKDLTKNFIIYENGTFAYLLINIYLENLTRPIDADMFNYIVGVKVSLEKNKCHIVPKSHFNSFILSFQNYYANLKECITLLLSSCGNCLQSEHNEEDFQMDKSFNRAFSFYFEGTPHIEILCNGKMMKYYIKLSPICKCLTPEMKDEFHDNIDRASAKTKTANLFNQVEFFRFQLGINKKILDAFQKAPILNLIFNHYMFYRNLFLIISVIINILIFMSFYRTTDDEREVTSLKDYDLKFDYGFLYKKENIESTKKTFMALTIFELVLAGLILVNYFIFRISYLIYNRNQDEEKGEKKDKKFNHQDYKSKGIIKYLFERLGNFIINLIFDTKLIYHLFLLVIIIVTLILQKYKMLSILLLDIIERSSTLMCIVKSFWIPKNQIIVTLVLFYLVAYYFIILVYLFIPNEVPKKDCYKFADCYFTLVDQAIKNSNGIINYLLEEGLYISDSLWSNPRFWIDNWFAILDIMLVMQMFCGIIIDTYLSQRENNRKIEKDKNNKCFICGLNKTELNKYYSSEFGFYEHIKLDHYLWNYMFAVFNVTTNNESNMIFMDEAIKRGYETNVLSSWVPYNKCINQLEIDSNKNENLDEDKEKGDNEENEEED